MDINEMRTILDKKALSDLPQLCEDINPQHAQELVDCIDGYVQWLTRASSYIDARTWHGMKHESAVEYSNKQIEKVRRAMGYSYPKQDISF